MHYSSFINHFNLLLLLHKTRHNSSHVYSNQGGLTVAQCDGSYEHAQGHIQWTIPLIDKSNRYYKLFIY